MSNGHDPSLGGEMRLLKSVSRSFFLSIRFLPRPVRSPVALAYLLARATDTVADVASARAADRIDLLVEMGRAIDGASVSSLAGRLARMSSSIDHRGERELLERWDELMAAFTACDDDVKTIVRSVLGEIVRGQTSDITTFEFADATGGGERGVVSLATSDDLTRYTFQVAGCVGRFWTEISVLRIGGKCVRGSIDDQTRLGIEFGQGLQMVNILRDFPEDLENGRCYLPLDWQRDAGVGPGDPAAMWGAADTWRRQCRSWISAGLEYAEGLRGVRMRFAAVLPALLAQETLDKVERASWDELTQRVKVSRRDVRRLMIRALRFAMCGG